jgi:glycosyltransferase involved in cell wall biosynthesis
MRILVISNLYPPEILGGYEILCAQVVDELRLRGHDVTVLTSVKGTVARPPDGQAGKPESIAGTFAAPGATVDSGVLRRLQLYRSFGQSAGLLRRRRLRTHRINERVTRETISKVKPDVVFVWSQLRLTLGAAHAAEESGIPTAYTLNDEYLAGYLPVPFEFSLRRILGWLEDRFLYREITLQCLDLKHVTTISAKVRDNLVHQGVAVPHARVIHQGIPIELFPRKREPGARHDPFRVVYAGQLLDYKGVHTMMDAVAMLARSRGPRAMEVTVAGSGPAEYRERLAAIAGKAGFDARFPGRLAQAELAGLYRENDVLVFPSIWEEPFGLTHLEAMASGTPVVSTANGGQGEFLEDGVNALVFSPGDTEALAACLSRLMEDENLRRDLAIRGRERVESRYNLSRYVDDLVRFLEDAVGGNA